MVAGLELLVMDQLVLLGQLVHTLVVLQLPLASAGEFLPARRAGKYKQHNILLPVVLPLTQ